MNLWNQDVGLDSNVLLANSAPDSLRELDSNQSLAENGFLDDPASDLFLADSKVECSVDDTDNNHVFGKVRRENVCRDPQLGQGREWKNKPTPNPFDAYKRLYTITDPLAPFPPDSLTCSPRNFESSNIPVCKAESPPEDIVPVPFTRAFTLYNIDPSTAKSISLCRHSQPMLIKSVKLSFLSLRHYVLPMSHCGVAKVFCRRYVFPQICPTLFAMILTYRTIFLGEII